MRRGTRKRRRFERETFIDTTGMDHRQARRLVRRVRQGRRTFFFDEFAAGWEPLYDWMGERIYEPCPCDGLVVRLDLPRRPWIKHHRR